MKNINNLLSKIHWLRDNCRRGRQNLSPGNNSYLIIGFCSILLLRIIPHIANCVPVFALLTIISSSGKLSKKTITILTLGTILVSDLLLSIMHGYPILGSYSLFTYSGFILVILLSLTVTKNQALLLVNTIAVTAGYWLWTNFGVWLVDGVYSLDLNGLSLCYTMALPFLKYSAIANVLGILLFIWLQSGHLCCLNTSQRNCINNIVN